MSLTRRASSASRQSVILHRSRVSRKANHREHGVKERTQRELCFTGSQHQEGASRMKRAVPVFVFAVLGLVCQLPAQNAQPNSIRQAILGNWKLVSYTREELASGAKSNVMGDHPSGYINFGSDGRMMVIIAGSGRKKPAGAIATPEEAKALITSMLAYGG